MKKSELKALILECKQELAEEANNKDIKLIDFNKEAAQWLEDYSSIWRDELTFDEMPYDRKVVAIKDAATFDYIKGAAAKEIKAAAAKL